MIERARYRPELAPNGQRATLSSPAGEHRATLSLRRVWERRRARAVTA
jgi:hypothetical protein